MTLEKLFQIFREKGVQTVYAKKLAENDNSKNQVYLGGGFEVLNILPVGEIKTCAVGKWERHRFKAPLNFSWLTELGKSVTAPYAQLILYPKYPEVRFSGFLKGCPESPSALMASRLAGRILFLGSNSFGQTFGFVVNSGSQTSNAFLQEETMWSQQGMFHFRIIGTSHFEAEMKLLAELRRIHRLGWINAKRLSLDGANLPCDAPNCGGYTLEAELGITPNGFSGPDFMGWEIKQFGVIAFEKWGSKAITLMTPEPTGGYYKENGPELFIRKYGYADKKGRVNRLNFGGTHYMGKLNASTKLQLELIGFETSSGKISDVNGQIALLDPSGSIAAAWDFASLIKHWVRKHSLACYVPSICEKGEGKDNRRYAYGSEVLLGKGADFQKVLIGLSRGMIYYDPGIKLENLDGKPSTKRRSQFRIKSQYLGDLYQESKVVSLLK